MRSFPTPNGNLNICSGQTEPQHKDALPVLLKNAKKRLAKGAGTRTIELGTPKL